MKLNHKIDSKERTEHKMIEIETEFGNWPKNDRFNRKRRRTKAEP